MNLRSRTNHLTILAIGLASLALPLRADYLYTVNFGELDLNIDIPGLQLSGTYPADSFSFTLPSLFAATTWQTIATPGASLDGFSFSSIQMVADTNYNVLYLALDPVATPGWEKGDLDGFWFIVDGLGLSVGTYSVVNGVDGLADGRAIEIVDAGPEANPIWDYFYGPPGGLTIVETGSTVPDASDTLCLMALSLACLAVLRRRFVR